MATGARLIRSRLILASRSPRRQEALAALGIEHEVAVSDVEERLAPPAGTSSPAPIAIAKALDIASRRAERPVVAGDTVVVVDGRVLGKPQSPAQAREMLRVLRGRAHTVRSAVAAIGEDRSLAAEVSCPLVMRSYTDSEVEAYVASGEPLDCAGAYDVHRLGGTLVEEVRGCFATVVGLPIVQLVTMLRTVGHQEAPSPEEAAMACTRLYGRRCMSTDPSTIAFCLAESAELQTPRTGSGAT